MKNLDRFKLIGIDSNIFIYYFEGNAQFGKAAKKILDSLGNNTLSGTTSMITVIEALSKKELSRKVAKDLENDFFDIPNLTILEVNKKIGAKAASIRREYGFRLADSIQLATAIISKAQAFITNDERLKVFKKIKIVLLK